MPTQRPLRFRSSYLLPLVAALFIGAAIAITVRTTGTIDLQAEYGLSWQHDHTLAEHGFTYDQVKTKLPLFIQWAEFNKWTQPEVLSLAEIDADWIQAFYECWGNFGQAPDFTAAPKHRGHIIAPDGSFGVNYPLPVGFGEYVGQGSNSGKDAYGHSAGTQLRIDHAKWLTAKSADRVCMRSVTWNDRTLLGYAQGTIVRGFNLEGGRAGLFYDPSFHSSGLQLGDPGEASSIRDCFANGFNDFGYEVQGGTPGSFIDCSAFYNNRSGFGFFGRSGLHNTTLIVPSGDDNRLALIETDQMSNGVAGGTLTIIGAKKENRAAGGIFLYARGAFNIIINGATCANEDTYGKCVDAEIVLKGTSQYQLDVRGMKAHNFQTLVQDITAHKRYTGPGSYAPVSFVVNELGVFNATRPITASTCNCTDRLGTWAWGTGGAITPGYNYTACTPTWSNTGTNPPPAPVWVLGTQTCGTCTNNVLTCTTPYISSISGQTPTDPKPADVISTTACGTVPPGPGAELSRTGWLATASATNATNVAANVLDGNVATVWSSGIFQSATTTQWIRIDMLQERTLGSIQVNTTWNTDYPRKAQVYVTSTTTLPTTGGVACNATTPDYTVQLGSRKGRYLWMVQSTDANTKYYWFTVGELRVFAP